jgi:hypothetical protein
LADRVLLKIVCLLMRWSFSPAVPMIRCDRAKHAGLMVLRHENAVLRRKRYEPADRAWFAALTRFIPRRRRAEVFPVTPRRCWPGTAGSPPSKRHKPGRPATIRSIARLTVRLARENRSGATAVSTAS